MYEAHTNQETRWPLNVFHSSTCKKKNESILYLVQINRRYILFCKNNTEVHIWEDICSMMIFLPWYLWPAGLCKRCTCWPTFPTSYFDASAAQSTWCRPCCPDLWLKSSVTHHWEAGWQHSGQEKERFQKGQAERNIYDNSVTNSVRSRSYSV